MCLFQNCIMHWYIYFWTQAYLKSMKILPYFIETTFSLHRCALELVLFKMNREAQFLEGVSKTLFAQNTCNRHFTSSLKCLSSILFHEMIYYIACPERLNDK